MVGVVSKQGELFKKIRESESCRSQQVQLYLKIRLQNVLTKFPVMSKGEYDLYV